MFWSALIVPKSTRRRPGQGLEERLNDALFDFLFGLALLFAGLLVALCVFLLPSHYQYLLPAIMFCGAVAVMLVKAQTVGRLRKGLRAERKVGDNLDRLMRVGAHVFHDIETSLGNIDHVIVSDRGVFAVETKYMSSPEKLSLGIHPDVTRQIRRNAGLLGRWFREAGLDIWVNPIIIVPGCPDIVSKKLGDPDVMDTEVFIRWFKARTVCQKPCKLKPLADLVQKLSDKGRE